MLKEDESDDSGDDELDGIEKDDVSEHLSPDDEHDPEVDDDVIRSQSSSPDGIIQFTAGPGSEEEFYDENEAVNQAEAKVTDDTHQRGDLQHDNTH